MRKVIFTIVASVWALTSFSQGLVNFNNASSIAGWNPIADRHVYFHPYGWPPFIPPGQIPVSSNYGGLNLIGLRAALYYAPSTVTDIFQFQAAAGGPATFKVSTSATAGSWFGGMRTLSGIAPGTTANLLVVVWDSSLSSDPFSTAAMSTWFWGTSAIFQYTSPVAPGLPPSEMLPQNLSSFFIGFPEPSALALVSLGAAALVILRRRS